MLLFVLGLALSAPTVAFGTGVGRLPQGSSPHGSYLRGVAFVTALRGWVVGPAGAIWVTTDGGATWMAQPAGTAQALDAVSFADAGRGWAVGAGGTVQATSDGGATWRTAPPKPAIIRQLIAFGAKRRAETVVYNRRHYGQATWRLTPKVIVLHYTDGGTEAGTHAAFNADRPDLGVLPGVVAHFVIDRNGRIYQQLPLNVRGRHTVGLNYVAIGVEFVQVGGPSPTWATNQIFHHKAQIGAGVRLVRWLQWRYEIKPGNIVGHDTANASPYFRDLLHWRNTHVDWLAPAVRRFRALLGG